MKQKLLGDILYVFSIEPYEITQDTSAETIKVQQECYEGYVELNPDLASKIVKYNYHMFTVTQQEWAPYVDADDKPSPELAWSAESATVTIGADDNVFPTLSNPHSVTVSYESSDTTKATIDASTGSIALVAEGNTTISASFAGDSELAPQTVSYALTVQQDQPSVGHTLTLDGSYIHANVNVYFDNVQQTVEYQYQDVAENTVIDIYPTDNVANYDLNSGATWDTDHWTATMPDSDLTISISYVLPSENQGVTVTYNVQDTSEPLKVYGWPDDSYSSNVPDQMFVDGVRQTVAATYQFSTTGSHTIQYLFYDGCFDIGLNNIGAEASYNIYVTDVTVGINITSVADYAWGIKAGYEPGASQAQPLPLTYLPTVPPTINSTGASSAEAPGATVYVPADSVTAYQAASVWSDISALIQAIPV